MNLSKPKRYQSDEYKDFIRVQPCCVPGCNRRRNSKNNKKEVDPSHLKTVGSGGSDLTCVPKCDCHHSEYHTIGCKTFEKKYNLDFKDLQIKYLQMYVEKLEAEK